MGLEGAFSAQHPERLSIILTEEVNVLAMLPTVSLPQRAQGHRDHEGLCLLFLLAEGTEQDCAGGLGSMWEDGGNHHRQKMYPQVAVTASSRGSWQAGQKASSQVEVEGITVPSPAHPLCPLPQATQIPFPSAVESLLHESQRGRILVRETALFYLCCFPEPWPVSKSRAGANSTVSQATKHSQQWPGQPLPHSFGLLQ